MCRSLPLALSHLISSSPHLILGRLAPHYAPCKREQREGVWAERAGAAAGADVQGYCGSVLGLEGVGSGVQEKGGGVQDGKVPGAGEIIAEEPTFVIVCCSVY